MKNFILVIGTLIAVSANADQNQPLLQKRTFPGFLPAAYATSSSCAVYNDRVEITKSAGSLKITTSNKIEAIAGGIRAQIEAAAKGSISMQDSLPDAGLKTYTAFNADGTEVKLRTNGSRTERNDSTEAATLSNLLDVVCGD